MSENLILRKKRKVTQGLSALLSNAHFTGLASSSIYKGPLKKVCVPGLHCYSCPMAAASCPVGAFQATVNSAKFSFSFYATGFLSLIGIFTGRFVCGWLCPFGLFQEVLNKIPLPKIKVQKGADRILRFLKYFILTVFVILVPIFVADEFGGGFPAFCKYICPAGILEGGVPFVLLDEGLRSTVGFLFKWKMAILILTIVLSILIYRPFCKYICPLGAFYSFFNRICFFRLNLDKTKCIRCGRCGDVCPMQVSMPEKINAAECIHCGKCIDECSEKAISILSKARSLSK